MTRSSVEIFHTRVFFPARSLIRYYQLSLISHDCLHALKNGMFRTFMSVIANWRVIVNEYTNN